MNKNKCKMRKNNPVMYLVTFGGEKGSLQIKDARFLKKSTYSKISLLYCHH